MRRTKPSQMAARSSLIAKLHAVRQIRDFEFIKDGYGYGTCSNARQLTFNDEIRLAH
jgi:hypothetical protein